jgi:hypothetical protein
MFATDTGILDGASPHCKTEVEYKSIPVRRPAFKIASGDTDSRSTHRIMSKNR